MAPRTEHPAAISPYGLQRDMMMFATRDHTGRPRVHRYVNSAEVIRVRGALDVGRLARAAERTAADMDTLAGRFEHGSGRDTFVFDPSRRRMSHAFAQVRAPPAPRSDQAADL